MNMIKCNVCHKPVENNEPSIIEHLTKHRPGAARYPISQARKCFSELTDSRTDEILEVLYKMALLDHSEAAFVPPTRDECGELLNKRVLRYKVKLAVRDRVLIETEYTMGVGHCPAYKKVGGGYRGNISLEDSKIIIDELNHGVLRSAQPPMQGMHILPNMVDVWYCIVQDGMADDMTFKEWCSDYGYNDDSITALRTHETCVEYGRALRVGLGAQTLEELREMFQDY